MNLKELLNEFIEREKAKGFREDTIRAKKRHVSRYLKSIKYGPQKLTEDSIVIYLVSLRENELCWEKVDLNLTHIQQFCEFLILKECLLQSPARDINRMNIRSCSDTGIYTRGEVKSLLKSASKKKKRKVEILMKRDRSIIELFYSTGIRLSELINLDIEDVDFEHREIFIYDAKYESDRIVPVGEEALNALMEYLPVRVKLLKPEKERDALFLSLIGNRFSVPGMLKMIYRRKDEAGIETRGATHAFRRSCASHMLANGAPVSAIRKILGHSSLDTTKKYALAFDDDLKRIYKDSHPGAKLKED